MAVEHFRGTQRANLGLMNDLGPLESLTLPSLDYDFGSGRAPAFCVGRRTWRFNLLQFRSPGRDHRREFGNPSSRRSGLDRRMYDARMSCIILTAREP